MNFEAFFTQLHNYSPFPWQSELARLACADEWPEFIAVPTGSGKTRTVISLADGLYSVISYHKRALPERSRWELIINHQVKGLASLDQLAKGDSV